MNPSADSLERQAELAPDFLARTWPEARDQAAALGQQPVSVGSVLICGCGDSHHAAVGLEAALAAGSGRPVRAATAMEAGRYLLPRHLERPGGLLLIAISASGEVARTLEALELGRRAGAQTLALTTQSGSSLALAADRKLSVPIPDLPQGPGLLSYLASLLMGYALADAWTEPRSEFGMGEAIVDLTKRLGSWISEEAVGGRSLAESVDPYRPTVFLGSGPAFGSAMFAAAKVIEAAGTTARGQDVEEWAHLEYFCDPASQTVWLLSAEGRSSGREREVINAAGAIGRRVHVSRWTQPAHNPWLREMLAPLALWAGPTAFASQLMHRLGERPFRGFAGGRSQEEGGGPSQIRSSRRWLDPAGSSAGSK